MARAALRTALLVLVPLAGCTGSPAPSANERTFVAQMLPHHHLGMRLLEDGAPRVASVEVRRLIFEMGGYHGPEITRLEQWAREWSVAPSPDFPGAIEEVSLAGLARLTGAGYDAEWLRLMIAHHEGALRIASETGAQGLRESLRRLASTLVEAQTREIARMRALLAAAPSTG